MSTPTTAPGSTTAPGPAATPGPVTVTTTGHVGLNVSDLARSLAFYRDVFGFDLLLESTEAGRRYAFLGRDGVPVVTLWEQASGSFDPARPGLHHLAFDVPTAEDVAAAEARLAALGVPLVYDRIVPHRPGAGSGGIFFTDPDGTRLEICTRSGLEGVPPRDDAAPSCGFF